jgi:hypothetical protein
LPEINNIYAAFRSNQAGSKSSLALILFLVTRRSWFYAS